MTREKKELLKQLRAIDESERLEMSIGPLSPRALEGLREEIDELERPILERLNELMHGRLNDFFGAYVIPN